MTEDLAFSGPAALAAKVRSREVRPRELVELYLRRIERLDPSLNAFRVTIGEQALADADAAEVVLATGGDQDRPLLGVPFAVKDNMALAGQRVTYGSRSSAPVATADAEIVRRLRTAGAIPIGVTNVPELMAYTYTATFANGVSRNPWNVSRTPGGSSGCSAAAVAAGLAPFATASDGGGSIRIPAACCGLVGLKPTRGRVSLAPMREGWFGLSVYGAYARSVADTALLYDVISGSIPGDGDSLAPLDPGALGAAAGRAPGRLRIAASTLVPGSSVELGEDQRGAWESARGLLGELGHDLSERDPEYGAAAQHFTQTYLRGVAEQLATLEQPEMAEASTRQLARLGRTVVPGWRRDRLRAQRAELSAGIMALWDDIDVLLIPALAQTPLPAEGAQGQNVLAASRMMSAFSPYTAVFNLTGQPAIVVPWGLDANGVPLSVQLVGALGREDLVLSLAAQIEAARPWAALRPAAAG